MEGIEPGAEAGVSNSTGSGLDRFVTVSHATGAGLRQLAPTGF